MTPIFDAVATDLGYTPKKISHLIRAYITMCRIHAALEKMGLA